MTVAGNTGVGSMRSHFLLATMSTVHVTGLFLLKAAVLFSPSQFSFLSKLMSHHSRLHRHTCIVWDVLLTNILGKTFLLFGGKFGMVGPYSHRGQHEALSTESTVHAAPSSKVASLCSE